MVYMIHIYMIHIYIYIYIHVYVFLPVLVYLGIFSSYVHVRTPNSQLSHITEDIYSCIVRHLIAFPIALKQHLKRSRHL